MAGSGRAPATEAAWNQVQSMWDFVGDAEAAPELLELRRVALTNARNSARRRERRTWFTVMGLLGTAARRRVVIAAAVAVIAVVAVIGNLVSDIHGGDVVPHPAGRAPARHSGRWIAYSSIPRPSCASAFQRSVANFR